MPALHLPGSRVDAGHLLAAFDNLCIWFGLHTPPSTHSATGIKYLLSARRESMNSKHCVSDSKCWRSSSSAMLSLAGWIGWDLTLLTCAQSWYMFGCVIFNEGRCISIPLSRSPFCMPHISNNTSFQQKHTRVPDGCDGSNGTLYLLTENYSHTVTQAMGRIAYLPPLLCTWNLVTYMHLQNNTCVTLFPGAVFTL